MIILDGRKLASQIKENIAEEIKTSGIKPGLAVIIAGDNPASNLYMRMKQKACEKCGIVSRKYEFSSDAAFEEIKQTIEKLNNDDNVHAILVQLPLPEHLNEQAIMNLISPAKDVDGFHKVNMGNLLLGNEKLAPCTPKGIIKLLEHYNIEIEGKDITIVGHSNIVGKPLAAMLLNRNATITVCHIKTKNLSKHTVNADILISATGVPNLIKQDMVKQGAVVVDVGTTYVNNKLKGDVDFEDVAEKSSFITPVPGGVGPMTVAMLMENTLICAKGGLYD